MHTITTTPPAADTTVERPTLADELNVVPWPDPVIDASPGAVPTSSDDALVWYVPLVGTIGMLMAHRWASYAADGPSTWTYEDIAGTFGIGKSVTRVEHSLDRLARFGIIRRHGRTVAVRLWLAPLTYCQRAQLPGYLADAYPH